MSEQIKDTVRDVRKGFAWFNKSFLQLGLSWKANLVYMALATFAHSETQVCFPSKETIATMVGISKSTVYEGLKELKDAGVIEINVRENDQSQTSNEYVLLPIPFRNTENPMRNTNPPPCAIRTPPVRNTNPNKNNLNKNQMNKVATRRTPKKAVATALSIPVWLDQGVWDAFREMRRRIRAPMTDTAEKLLVDRLARFRAAGHDPKELLENAIMNCWKSVYIDTVGRTQQRSPVKLVETEFKK